ncbi:hypothetical protein ACN4EK_24135 [Pantanalinema rosaneae CENA516]|jgi:hypothetical protein|uniref:hypothetical protein n=1 Tax=Pantanalinema rosaneae TaxID=1620701 RepID=UPI003D6E38C4
MVYTVWSAFNQFRQNTVDLDPNAVKVARSSRDHLFEQIERLAQNNVGFPKLQGSFLPFGSFARRAKTRPLNDIDLLILLKGNGLEVQQAWSSLYTYRLKLVNSKAPLAFFVDEYGYINSTRILNSFKSNLSLVSSYQKAELKRSMQAVVLNLKSYSWVYDIVPAVPVEGYDGKISYFLIPDGAGNWIRTDPRTDSKNITEVSLKHNGKFLPTMRLLKYWNFRVHKPRLASYYFETLAIKVFQYAPAIEDYPKAIKYFFDYCPSYLQSSCPDPKGLGSNLDENVTWETKTKVVQAMNGASKLATAAFIHEARAEQKQAIACWRQVFGSEFPIYG